MATPPIAVQLQHIRPAWRDRLHPASFNGIQFHVDTGELTGGRRTVPHEFPKRNIPYTEDLGRRAKRFSVAGYIIGRTANQDYTLQRDALIAELDRDPDPNDPQRPGVLILPLMLPIFVNVDTYTVIETRERGGMCVIEMTFLETGDPLGKITRQIDTIGQVQSGAAQAADSIVRTLDGALQGNTPVAPPLTIGV